MAIADVDVYELRVWDLDEVFLNVVRYESREGETPPSQRLRRNCFYMLLCGLAHWPILFRRGPADIEWSGRVASQHLSELFRAPMQSNLCPEQRILRYYGVPGPTNEREAASKFSRTGAHGLKEDDGQDFDWQVLHSDVDSFGRDSGVAKVVGA